MQARVKNPVQCPALKHLTHFIAAFKDYATAARQTSKPDTGQLRQRVFSM